MSDETDSEEDKKLVNTPPTTPKKSIQFDLFSQFCANDHAEVSNAVEIWDSIPKYFFTPRQIEKLRTGSGHADPFTWDYHYNNAAFSVRIQPALIEQPDGSYRAFFPGVTEELVEEALKKILADQTYGFHDVSNTETWVRFTLNMIKRELAARGRARNIPDIKHAIEVMSSCMISVRKNGKELWKGAILQDLVTVGRKEYLADTDSHHLGRLPLFISHAINRLGMRQFNLDRLMTCDDQLSRWIYRKMIHRFTQAHVTQTYHFLFSTIQGESALLQQGRDIDNRRKVRNALEELKRRGVVMVYSESLVKQGRKVVDAKYEVRPSTDFSTEQKAANKRDSDNKRTAQSSGIRLIIDNQSDF